MPKFSQRSLERLGSCDLKLQRLMFQVILEHDCVILEGHRDQHRQDELYITGKSRVMWPNSLHNAKPSRAVDVIPYPIDWSNTEDMVFLAGSVIAIAECMDINIRWGGDWDMDGSTKNNRFNDLAHYELNDD